MKSTALLGTVAFLVVCFSLTRADSAIPFAEYDPGVPPYTFAMGIGKSSFLRGQSFTAEYSGDLSRLEVFVMRLQGAETTSDLLVELRAGTMPNSPVLGSGVIPFAAVPEGEASSPGTFSNATFLGVDLAPVPVQAGNLYSVWLRTSGNSETFGWWGNGSNPYSGGTALTNSSTLTSLDVGFRATVVPEPGTACMLITGSLFLLVRRSKGRRVQF